MSLSRRGFLGALAAMAAAAAVPTVAAKVIQTQPNKYAEAIRIYDLCVEHKADKVLLHTHFDALLAHLHANFTTAVTDANMSATKDVLRTMDIEGWRKIPPTVIDAVYPIALARMALRFDELPIQPSKLTEFDTFHKRYGALIIQSYQLPA